MFGLDYNGWGGGMPDNCGLPQLLPIWTKNESWKLVHDRGSLDVLRR